MYNIIWSYTPNPLKYHDPIGWTDLYNFRYHCIINNYGYRDNIDLVWYDKATRWSNHVWRFFVCSFVNSIYCHVWMWKNIPNVWAYNNRQWKWSGNKNIKVGWTAWWKLKLYNIYSNRRLSKESVRTVFWSMLMRFYQGMQFYQSTAMVCSQIFEFRLWNF